MTGTQYVLAKETLEAFAKLMGRYYQGQLMRIFTHHTDGSSLEASDGDVFEAILPTNMSVTNEVVRPGTNARHAGSVVAGLHISGFDYDETPPAELRLFAPLFAGIEFYSPRSDLFSDLFNAAAGIVQHLGGAEEPVKAEAIAMIAEQMSFSDITLRKDSPFDMFRSLYAGLNHNCQSVTSDTVITNVRHNGEHAFFDMVITDLIEVPDGVIVGFYDISTYADPKEAFARLLIGQEIPLPKDKTFALISSLEQFAFPSAQDHAKWRLNFDDLERPETFDKNMCLTSPNPLPTFEELRGAIGASYRKDLEVIFPGYMVISALVNGQRTNRMIVTGLHKTPSGTVMRYRRCSAYPKREQAAMDIRLVAGLPNRLPDEESVLVCSFEIVEQQFAADGAAKVLLNAQGRNPLWEDIGESTSVVSENLEMDLLKLTAFEALRLDDISEELVAHITADGKTHEDLLIVSAKVDGNTIVVEYRDLNDYEERFTVFGLMARGDTAIPAPPTPRAMVVHNVESVMTESVERYGARRIGYISLDNINTPFKP